MYQQTNSYFIYSGDVGPASESGLSIRSHLLIWSGQLGWQCKSPICSRTIDWPDSLINADLSKNISEADHSNQTFQLLICLSFKAVNTPANLQTFMYIFLRSCNVIYEAFGQFLLSNLTHPVQHLWTNLRLHCRIFDTLEFICRTHFSVPNYLDTFWRNI